MKNQESTDTTIYLTKSDAAKLAGITPAAIRAAALAGRLPIAAQTAGGQRLFARADVEEFAHRRGGQPVHARAHRRDVA